MVSRKDAEMIIGLLANPVTLHADPRKSVGINRKGSNNSTLLSN